MGEIIKELRNGLGVGDDEACWCLVVLIKEGRAIKIFSASFCERKHVAFIFNSILYDPLHSFSKTNETEIWTRDRKWDRD